MNKDFQEFEFERVSLCVEWNLVNEAPHVLFKAAIPWRFLHGDSLKRAMMILQIHVFSSRAEITFRKYNIKIAHQRRKLNMYEATVTDKSSALL